MTAILTRNSRGGIPNTNERIPFSADAGVGRHGVPFDSLRSLRAGFSTAPWLSRSESHSSAQDDLSKLEFLDNAGGGVILELLRRRCSVPSFEAPVNAGAFVFVHSLECSDAAVTIWQMAEGTVSQRSIIALKRVLEILAERGMDFSETLYENDFPDWLITQAGRRHFWDWMGILLDLRRGTICFQKDFTGRARLVVPRDAGVYTEQDAVQLCEIYIRMLAALAVVLAESSREAQLVSESLIRSLQLDGFDIDKARLRLVPLEGPVSAQQEEDNITRLVKASGVHGSPAILRHVEDAHSLYAEGKYHASLNESRNLVQALIDGIAIDTSGSGQHATAIPGGTGPRIEYLRAVRFFTPDEEAAFKSAWGSLSAGSHPGVPDREQARIGLVLALEFGQLLVLKLANWRANAYLKFS